LKDCLTDDEFHFIGRILKAGFQKFFKQNKTFIQNKADHGLSSVRNPIRVIRAIRV
jgi:hypothetical protein